MEARKLITTYKDIRIEYKNPFSNTITFENICKAKLNPEDVIVEIAIRSGFNTEPVFGSYNYNDEKTYYNYPVLIQEIKRLETDEEFTKRIKEEEKIKNHKENQEWTEYLRLKAKFD